MFNKKRDFETLQKMFKGDLAHLWAGWSMFGNSTPYQSPAGPWAQACGLMQARWQGYVSSSQITHSNYNSSNPKGSI